VRHDAEQDGAHGLVGGLVLGARGGGEDGGRAVAEHVFHMGVWEDFEEN
jgi:hypothetical protein